jgi:hypothetical protein
MFRNNTDCPNVSVMVTTTNHHNMSIRKLNTMYIISDVRKNLVWGEGVVIHKNVLFSIFILYYYIKKKNSIKAEIHPSVFTLNSSIICRYGKSRCMLINAIHLTVTAPSYFLDTFLNV